MNEFIALFACISTFTTTPVYRDGAYIATIQVECSKEAFKTPFSKVIEHEGAVRKAALSIVLKDNKLVATSMVEVERPWIAPQPIFMSVAEGKHKDTVVQQIIDLYNGKKEK